METSHEHSSVSAAMVMTVRERTGLPVLECKKLLGSMTPVWRSEWLAMCESQTGSLIHDPQEDDPQIRPLFESICAEVAVVVEQEHAKHIAEWDARSPAIATLFRKTMGSCHRHWRLIKQLMKERHGINWRSPADLNPGTFFD
jgi:hypothetical protein